MQQIEVQKQEQNLKMSLTKIASQVLHIDGLVLKYTSYALMHLQM